MTPASIGPEVVAIFGPTASGKTAVAEALADSLGTSVVSADAMQVYRGLPVLTNQPDRATLLVGMWPLEHESSVGEYAGLAHAAIDELVEAHGAAVVTGGTGLYLRAALAELDLPAAPSVAARTRWEAAYEADPEAAYAQLQRRDPDAAVRIHQNDRRRVVRALELAETGASLARARDRLWAAETRRPTLIVGLSLDPMELERRIGERTDEMFRRGVVEEVRTALAAGTVSRTAGKALGLTEIAGLPPEEARATIVLRTRRYAAYQRKWMRRIPGIVMIEAASEPARPARLVADEILEVARTR
jgi:tRNA dimethylallyltransferase